MPASKVIAKARPTHPSLNFETLRQEGIQYLEKVATEVWTDYNAHDPGITLLELLCYAITDLGYRTQMLPVADLMADPNRQYKPWFTAAEVLPAAPVTGMDYRKLLIDVKGVKNAWIARGEGEVELGTKGVVFPGLISDDYAISDENKEALNDFLGNHWDKIPGLEPDIDADGNPIKPSIDWDVLLEELKRKADSLLDLPEIRPYINAIGTKANLIALEKYEMKKQLETDPDLRPTHEEIDELWTNLQNPYWPMPDNEAVRGRVEALQRAGFGTIEAIIRAHDYSPYVQINQGEGGSGVEDGGDSTSGGNDPQFIIESLINYLINGRDTQLPPEVRAAYDLLKAEADDRDVIEHIYRQRYLAVFTDNHQYIGLVWSYLNSSNISIPASFEEKFKIGGLWQVRRVALQQFLTTAFSRPDNLEEIIGQTLDYFDSPSVTDDNIRAIVDYLFGPAFCAYGYWGVRPGLDSDEANDLQLPLSGLYEVLLDLDEDIDTGIPNEVEVVVERVRELLHANRALCEDVAAIRIVEQRPIAICLSMDVAEDADELEVVAEAVRRMQTYLSPAPRFRTFAQRLAELKAAGKNYSAEEIYNGPLLVNGFLVDEELGEAMPRGSYQHSDLLREAMSVAGVLGVPALQVKEHPESGTGTRFDEKTTYKVKGGDYTETNAYYKPVIDLKLSHFQVVKGARTLPLRIDPGHLAERLELLRLINATDPLDPPGGPVWEEGLYRPDLGRYRSLQYDLPATYTVGDNKPRHDAAPQRRAQARHLQAYLAFYDQIFASYLAQLERVRRLLSIDQPADVPTRVLPLLYEMPGMRNLITGDKAIITATELDWTLVLLDIREDIKSTPKEGNVHPNDREKVGQLLTGLRAQAEFKGIPAFRSALKSALSGYPRLYELYGEQIEDYFWRKYTKEHDNAYAREVRKIAESPADRRNRRNQLLDHLIARFGEAMGEYASTLLSPQYEPEDNPTQLSFDDFLASKAAFLRELAQLARERNRGYNYRLFRELENVADVWNTFNVSGLQKRVCRKLGITEWSTRSLIAEPAYRFDLVRGASQRGAANFRVALRRRETSARENPREAVPLMISPAYTAQRTAQDKVNELYKIVWQAAYYAPDRAVEAGVDYWFTLKEEAQGRRSAVLVKPYEAKAKGKKVKIKQGGADMEVEVLLQTEPLSADEATNWILDKIIPLVKPESTSRAQEGFHVVEHILLRPMEADDQLLQLHLGCVPEETPRDPYSFWITVVAPAQTTRFADPDFQTHFEQVFRSETPAHIGVRFCYLGLEDMYAFEEAFAVWMFEKARCAAPGHCQAEAATETLVKLLNDLHCSCGCAEPLAANPCEQPLKP